MNTKVKLPTGVLTSPELALSLIIGSSDLIKVGGRHILVIQLPPNLEDYLAAYGAEETEREHDDEPENDDYAEDDDPKE